MNNHDDQHYKRSDVREACRALEDDGVCDLNGAAIALRLDAVVAIEGRWRANERAKRQRHFRAYIVEAAEAHGADGSNEGCSDGNRCR